MGPRRRRSSSWRAAPAVGHSRRETKPGPHASSGREGPVRILANEGDGTGELPENVGFQRHPRAQLSADSNGMAESFVKTMKRDYVAFMPKPDAATAARNLAIAFEHYNDKHPSS